MAIDEKDLLPYTVEVPIDLLSPLAFAVSAIEGTMCEACDLAESSSNPRLWAMAATLKHVAEAIEPLLKYA